MGLDRNQKYELQCKHHEHPQTQCVKLRSFEFNKLNFNMCPVTEPQTHGWREMVRLEFRTEGEAEREMDIQNMERSEHEP